MSNRNDNKEVIFYSINEKFRLGADKIQREERFNDGRVSVPSKVILFYGGVYKTSDPKEIDVIKNCAEFKLGRVRIINMEELDFLTKLKAETIAKITSPTPTSAPDDSYAEEGVEENAPI